MSKRASIDAESVTFTLVHEEARYRAGELTRTAPDGWMVIFTPPTRTLEQNAKMWAMLADISRQVNWYGDMIPADEWKDMFTAALKRTKVRRGIEGGYVICGQSTKKMSIKAMAELIEYMYAFGAQHNVRWTEPDSVPAMPAWLQIEA